MEEETIVRPRVILNQADLTELRMLLGKPRLIQFGEFWGFNGTAADLAQFMVHLQEVVGLYEALLLATGVLEHHGWSLDGHTPNSTYLFPGLEVV